MHDLIMHTVLRTGVRKRDLLPCNLSIYQIFSSISNELNRKHS